MKKVDKLKQFFYNNKDYIYLLLIILSLILFFCYYGFTKQKISELTNSYLVIALIYILLFQIELFERFIIKNITIILILGVTFIMYNQGILGINNKDTLLMVGGIIGFWYGYKRYERDKELELINNNENLDFTRIRNKGLEEVISSWYLYYTLKDKNYISVNIWNIIDNKCKIVLYKDIVLLKEDIAANIIISILDLFQIDKKFIEYILEVLKNKLKDTHDESEKNNFNYIIDKIEIIKTI